MVKGTNIPRKKILLVEDDEDILLMLQFNLERDGYEVTAAQNGREALALAQEAPDLIILDVMIPEIDGWEVARRLKHEKRTAAIPLFFVTAKSSEVDEVIAFELGAADYLVKPIRIAIFLTRVKSILRNRDSAPDATNDRGGVIRLPDVEIDSANYSVRIRGKEVSFAKREFELLSYLGHHPGSVFSREALLREVWGNGAGVLVRTVDVHIRKIREKLGEYAPHIITVKKVGYKFTADFSQH